MHMHVVPFGANSQLKLCQIIEASARHQAPDSRHQASNICHLGQLKSLSISSNLNNDMQCVQLNTTYKTINNINIGHTTYSSKINTTTTTLSSQRRLNDNIKQLDNNGLNINHQASITTTIQTSL